MTEEEVIEKVLIVCRNKYPDSLMLEPIIEDITGLKGRELRKQCDIIEIRLLDEELVTIEQEFFILITRKGIDIAKTAGYRMAMDDIKNTKIEAKRVQQLDTSLKEKSLTKLKHDKVLYFIAIIAFAVSLFINIWTAYKTYTAYKDSGRLKQLERQLNNLSKDVDKIKKHVPIK